MQTQALHGAWLAFTRRAEDGWERAAGAFPPLGRAGTFVWEVLRKYHRDDCFTYAAGVTFFLAISLIPLATLFFKLLVLTLGDGAYSQSLLRTLEEVYPYLPRGFILDTLQHSRELRGLGISWVVLFIGGHWGVNQLDRSLCHIFGLRFRAHRQTRRHYFVRRTAVILGALLFLMILLGLGFQWSLRRRLPLSPHLWGSLLPPLLGVLLVTQVLQHLPRRHVKFRHALAGALVCSLLWWMARVAFEWYLRHTPTWGILYGSLGSLMAALVFLYYSCALFLLGAEVTAAFYGPYSRPSNREG